MKMRDLEKLTGVNRETIRVYFRHGLLPEPVRPRQNVADYDQTHVDAILAVRKLQKQNNMTLPQIRDSLAGKADAHFIEAGAFQHLDRLLSMRVNYNRTGEVSLLKLKQDFPNAVRDAETLSGMGLVSVSETEHGPFVNLLDARLIQIWGRKREGGFTEENGFPPSILSYYLDAAKYVAGHEAKIFFEQIDGKLSETQAADMLEMALPTMLEFFGLLRLRTFLGNVAKITKMEEKLAQPTLPKAPRLSRAKGPPRYAGKPASETNA